MTLQAEQLPALHPFSSKNTFCAGTLFCPAMIALENNGFMRNTNPALTIPIDLVQACILSWSLVQAQPTGKVLLPELSHQNESFSRLIRKLDCTEKHDSNYGNLSVKKGGSFQKECFFFNCQWGKVDPQTPPCVRHWPV